MAALKKNLRLGDRKIINSILRRGRYENRRGLAVYTQPSENPESRVAVVVSKKVDKRAVRRNKLRRQISEAMRALLMGVEKPNDFVILTKPEIIKMDFKDIKNGLEGILKSLKI